MLGRTAAGLASQEVPTRLRHGIARSHLEAYYILVAAKMSPQSHQLLQSMGPFTNSSCAPAIKPPTAQPSAAPPPYQTNLVPFSNTWRNPRSPLAAGSESLRD